MRRLLLVTIGVALLAPAAASANYTSSIATTTVTLTGDSAGDTLVISNSGGLLTHSLSAQPGFNSALDWDTAAAGDQPLNADGSITFHINAGAGDDVVNFDSGTSISGADIDTGDGNDSVLGAIAGETISG